MKAFFLRISKWLSWQDVLAVLALWALVACCFYPLFEGYVVRQSDTLNHRGFASELFDARAQEQGEIYWTGKNFSGMPTIQMELELRAPSVLDWCEEYIFPFFLGGRIMAFFLGLLGFYLLVRYLGVQVLLAVFLAMAYMFATYKITLLTSGHNSKLMSFAYFPYVFLAFMHGLRGSTPWQWALGLSGLASYFLFKANHIQMTYYFFFIYGFYHLALLWKSEEKKDFLRRTALLILGVCMGLLMNFNLYYSTYHFAKHTMRGGKKITIEKTADGKIIPLQKNKKGLDLEYMTQWSYAPAELLSYAVPAIKGYASGSYLNTPDFIQAMPSKLGKQVRQIAQQTGGTQFLYQITDTYWGEQPFTAGLMYLGAALLYFALFFFVFERHPYKWLILLGFGLALALSVGKHWMELTSFFADYFPFYNKFRAVGSFLGSLDFFIVLAAGLGVMNFIRYHAAHPEKILKFGGFLVFGLLVLMVFAPDMLEFSTSRQRQILLEYDLSDLLDYLEDYRLQEMRLSAAKTMVIWTLITILAYYFKRNAIHYQTFFAAILLIHGVDLLAHNANYFNNTKVASSYKYWMKKEEFDYPFAAQPADKQIYEQAKTPEVTACLAQWKSSQRSVNKKTHDELACLAAHTHFRVFQMNNPFSDPITSYFHKSIGGYSAVKLSNYQDLIDFYLQQEWHALQHVDNEEVLDMALRSSKILNMLNAQYIVFSAQSVVRNPYAQGAAWFVEKLFFASNPDQEITSLAKYNLTKVAVLPQQAQADLPTQSFDPQQASYTLDSYAPDRLIYTVQAKTPQFMVLSEIDYPEWKAELDGQSVPIYTTNYALRGVYIPAGTHELVLQIRPDFQFLGNVISQILIFLTLGLLGWGVQSHRAKK